ncbi:MAG: serine hydrolase [Gammaproteobacteria bacterium]|nr:serine hydrolase [Gammaproteobacteria bacterium]
MPLTRHDLHTFCDHAKKIQKERTIPNFVLSIIHPAENIISANGSLIDEKTLFPVGSISKGFAATVAAHLVDKGLIDWNDSIKKFIDIKMPNDIDLSVRQLLSHINPFPEHTLTEASEFGFSRKELIEKLQYIAINNEFKFSYQNILFSLIADIVQKVSGKTYQDYLSQHILIPLEMVTTTSVEKDYLDNNNKASPYIKHDNIISKIPYSSFWHTMGPPSCIATSITDLTRWMKFNLQIEHNTLISKKSLDAIHTPLAHSTPPYAMGWWKADEQGLVLSHTGSVTGFDNAIAIIPSCKIGIAVCSNLSGDRFAYDMLNEFIRRFLNEKTFSCTNVLQLKMPLSQPKFPLRKFIGDFYHPILESIKITYKNNSLHLEIGKNKTLATLTPITLLPTHSKITPQLFQLSQHACFQINWQSGMEAAGKVYYDNDIVSFSENKDGVIDTLLLFAESINTSLLVCKRVDILNTLIQTNSFFNLKNNPSESSHANNQIALSQKPG